MESRVFLSAYTLKPLMGQFSVNGTGANPRSSLIADASGNLFGTATTGGPYADGTVFEIGDGSSAITTLASFNGTNGRDPIVGLVQDASGNLYGATYQGGANDEGTVYELPAGSNSISTLASFNSANGAYPEAGLTLDGSGKLYGTTNRGGIYDSGTIFEIPLSSGTLTTLASFNGLYGIYGGVVPDASGNLYGTAASGGAGNYGAVYRFIQGTSSIQIWASFTKTDGAVPYAGLTCDAAGNLYGTTSQGGAYGKGTVFEMAATSAKITTLVSFNSTNGSGPLASVTLDSAGNLYGTTSEGGADSVGTVFEIPNGSPALTTIATFDQSVGSSPFDGVTFDALGNLYGTAYVGGTANTGTVFEIPQGPGTLTTVASFDGTSGTKPQGFAVDRSGNLYGTTALGGPNGDGLIFEIPKGSANSTTLAMFNGTNGASPSGDLTIDDLGNLFGTTAGGGDTGYGTVFELASGSNNITTLASFDSHTHGSGPVSGVILDAFGNLYGTAENGGAYGLGTVFEVAAGSNALTALAAFGGNNGATPNGRLALDAAGNLYGTTESGGSNGYGTVFEVARGSASTTTLFGFSPTTGSTPTGGVALDASGNIYGTTRSGGSNGDGIVFEIAHGTTTLTTLASFNLANGFEAGPVYVDPSGNLFGTTLWGGSNDDGTVFEVASGSGTITSLASFNIANGANPSFGVRADALGDLYGTTTNGGPGNAGTVFELAANSTVTLALASGSNPSTPAQPLGFTAEVSGGVPDGETVTLVDTSNNNAVVATGTLSGASATLTIPAGTLPVGTHNLIAAYAGDANFAASQSAPYTQTVQVAVIGVTVNENLAALAGVQRSMVDSIVYTFSDAVDLAATDAFSIATHPGQSGTVPTLAWTALNPNADGSSTQWAVTFSGAGVSGGSIGNGVYDITLNTAAVTSDANPTASVQSRAADTFYRLLGDANGDGRVNNADYAAFLNTNGLKAGQAGFDAAFDFNGDGRINNSDYAAFLTDNSLRYTGFSPTI
jgi:uncharacterized repeat protein (TIGR03803 family)